jgi:3-deoxy-manno-octulosonate cytidylyltransferase (CMP-KDO synthetase)
VFTVIIPARLASTRLPNKPLADIGGQPMVVRVAQQARLSAAARVVVACDDASIKAAVERAGFEALLTRVDCANGTERLAEAAELLGLASDAIVVNVQGDEPLIDPATINQVAAALLAHPQYAIATAAHRITSLADFMNPNVVKLCCAQPAPDGVAAALLFSRAPIPWPRDAFANNQAVAPKDQLPNGLQALRHVGLYAYRCSFLQRYSQLAATPAELAEALEQLRALEHGYSIAAVTLNSAPMPGVDTADDLQRVRQLFSSINL